MLQINFQTDYFLIMFYLYCLFCDFDFQYSVLAAVAGIIGRTNASQNVRTACKKCGYGKMIVTFLFILG